MKREEKNKFAEMITSDSDEYHQNQLSVAVKRGMHGRRSGGVSGGSKEIIVNGGEKNAGELVAVDSGK